MHRGNRSFAHEEDYLLANDAARDIGDDENGKRHSSIGTSYWCLQSPRARCVALLLILLWVAYSFGIIAPSHPRSLASTPTPREGMATAAEAADAQGGKDRERKRHQGNMPPRPGWTTLNHTSYRAAASPGVSPVRLDEAGPVTEPTANPEAEPATDEGRREDEDEEDEEYEDEPRCFVVGGTEYCLPSVVGLCCVRSGSTALAAYLDAHPMLSYGSVSTQRLHAPKRSRSTSQPGTSLEWEAATPQCVV